MSDDPEEAGDGMVPQGARALAIKSTQLVTRGLQELEILENKTEDRENANYEDAVLAFELGKSHIKAGRLSEALRAFKNALESQKDSGLYAYAVGLTSALAGDDMAVFEQEEALSAKGLTPLSDDLFQFLNKHADHIAELGRDDEFIALMCQLVESKIHAAELATSMASEFDRGASED